MFLKNFSSHTHAFYSQNKVLWGVFALTCFVFQIFTLPDFRSIESNFWQIENRFESFLKQDFLMCSSLYSNFSKSILLSLFDRSTSSQFLSFSSYFFSRFLSSSAGKTFLPLLFHFIHTLHAFFMHFRWNFRTYWILGFLICFLSKLITRFLFLYVINMFLMH